MEKHQACACESRFDAFPELVALGPARQWAALCDVTPGASAALQRMSPHKYMACHLTSLHLMSPHQLHTPHSLSTMPPGQQPTRLIANRWFCISIIPSRGHQAVVHQGGTKHGAVRDVTGREVVALRQGGGAKRWGMSMVGRPLAVGARVVRTTVTVFCCSFDRRLCRERVLQARTSAAACAATASSAPAGRSTIDRSVAGRQSIGDSTHLEIHLGLHPHLGLACAGVRECSKGCGRATLPTCARAATTLSSHACHTAPNATGLVAFISQYCQPHN